MVDMYFFSSSKSLHVASQATSLWSAPKQSAWHCCSCSWPLPYSTTSATSCSKERANTYFPYYTTYQGAIDTHLLLHANSTCNNHAYLLPLYFFITQNLQSISVNPYTIVCLLPVSPLVKGSVWFHCHLTLFVCNKLIYRCFKSVRWVQSILHSPAYILHTPPAASQSILSYAVDCTPQGRREICRSNRLFCSPMLWYLSPVLVQCGSMWACRLCVGGIGSILHWVKHW